MTSFAIYGNHGEYRMPHTPVFDTKAKAMAYARSWYPNNKFIAVKEATK
ncbi:hypothetical protein SEA_FENN_86 [Mycobacterium phage Fenn]|nr:hypothetical protein SEA_FENN_86 [Mycobacterium phage Fenn]QBI99353.1 hypothetical protein SEA_NAIRA_85 [Mycobacterium phage Naira]